MKAQTGAGVVALVVAWLVLFLALMRKVRSRSAVVATMPRNCSISAACAAAEFRGGHLAST
jgi:hypothetical protein